MRMLAPVLAGLAFAGAARAAATIDPALNVQVVVSGLSNPSGLAFIGDDDILVLQQLDGKVMRIVGGVLLPDPVLDLPVDSSVLDRGLLGIALDPDFVDNQFVYLDWVEATSDGGTTVGSHVTRFRWDGAALVEPLTILELPIRFNVFHVGGKLVFGADDMLYTIIGDLQFLTKLQNLSTGADPNDTSVIFRTTASGFAPPDNPFAGSTGTLAPMSRYYAYGLRNSFGLGIDPVTGSLWDTENGPNSYDEVNLVVPGMNSGWKSIQGPLARSSNDLSSLWMAPGAVYSDPEFSWVVPIAPTSITFVKNPKLGCLRLHDAIVAGTNCGLLYDFKLNAPRTGFSFVAPELADLVADNQNDQCGGEQAEITFASGLGIISDEVTGPDGLLYMTSLDQGTLYRIVPSRAPSDDADADGVEDACDCNPADAGAWSALT